MLDNDSPQNVIDSYKKRQKMMPFFIGGLAVLLVVVGVIVLIVWLVGPDGRGISLKASETPTVTNTYTITPVTPTSTHTITPTDTVEPTATLTLTPSGPFEYTVQEGDNCSDLATYFEVNLSVLLAINNFTSGTCPIQPGQTIFIPAPDQELPTGTPVPADLPYGTVIEHTVQSGETLAYIASLYNSTVEKIIEDNDIDDSNTIYVGQILKVKANIATPTRTLPPATTTVTSTQTSPAGLPITATP